MEPSVSAVVIAYNPSPDIVGNIGLISQQVSHVIIVDNTPDCHAIGGLDALQHLNGCTLIRNHENLGIAAALNIGIQYATQRGSSWILTFDQDSKIGPGYVGAMLSTHKEAAARCRVGIVCPQYEDARLGGLLALHRSVNGDIFTCFTSGSMIEAATFAALGPMEDRLFIDFVDIEYCLRLRTAGFKVVESKSAVLSHSLGHITWHRFWGIEFYTTNHSPGRRYYITRNRLVMMKRYFDKDREWVINDFKGMIVDTLKILLAERDKLLKATYMMRAFYDALFNRLGPRVAL